MASQASKGAAVKEEKSKSAKKKPNKDANGKDLIKRPLSAYMLYNNYRRPVLRQEHPGKSLLSFCLILHFCRVQT